MALQSILVCLLLMMGTGPQTSAHDSRQAMSLPPFLYTVAQTYEPLAWMHGADRFSSDATIYLREKETPQKLVPSFAASADPSVSFDGQRVLFAGKAHAQDPWQIWEVSVDGENARRITSGAEDCILPFYLPDNRIVYARKIDGHYRIEAVDIAAGKPLALTYGPANYLPTDVLRDGRILFESGYPLGSETTAELYTVYSDGSGVESYRCDHGATRHSARQSSSGDIILVSSHGLAKFTSARAREVAIPAPAGDYAGGVSELGSGDWLVGWRADGNVPFRLMHRASEEKELASVLTVPDANVVQPTLLAPRAIPNRHPSGLHDWPNANLLCLNAYTSKYEFAPGSIDSVKLYTPDPDGHPKLLGTAPVERDGSFFVQVPTEKPLQIELLDSAGKTLKREAGFFWMRRGEQRGCVGCHAGPETAPENAVPMILLKSTTPADMTGAIATAAGGH